MEKIYSKIEPNKLLHIIFRKEDFKSGRTNLIDEMEFIQCSALNLVIGTTFKPHKHIERNITFSNHIAQESWCIIQGSVKCIFYDLNDEILETPILNAGDTSFTLRGGHTYEILEDDTLVMEYKVGPYFGQQLDKIFIQ